MSSAFDTEVYTERQRLPGVTVSLQKLMNDLLWKSGENATPDCGGIQPVTLTLEYRPDVDTSSWWTVKWGDGQFTSAKELELCLFRAAVIARRDDERAKKYAGMATPAETGMTIEERARRLVGDMPWVTEHLTAEQLADLPKQIATSMESAVLATHFDLKKRLQWATAEVERLKQQVSGHCDRIAAQSEILSRRAEKQPVVPTCPRCGTPGEPYAKETLFICPLVDCSKYWLTGPLAKPESPLTEKFQALADAAGEIDEEAVREYREDREPTYRIKPLVWEEDTFPDGKHIDTRRRLTCRSAIGKLVLTLERRGFDLRWEFHHVGEQPKMLPATVQEVETAKGVAESHYRTRMLAALEEFV